MKTKEMKEKADGIKDDAQETAEELRERAAEWQHRAMETARKAGRAADDYLRDNPWNGIAGAAVLGCIVGFLLAKCRD